MLTVTYFGLIRSLKRRQLVPPQSDHSLPVDTVPRAAGVEV
jgi:hypothetical protein